MYHRFLPTKIYISTDLGHYPNFGGAARVNAVGFSIGNYGYAGTGFSASPSTYYNDFWEYSPLQSTDSVCDATFAVSTHDCVGDGVNFYSADTTATATHYWYFGSTTNVSPASSTQKNPTNIIFSQAGAYYVTHIITQGGTCSDTSVQVITINPVPVASFSSSAPVCVGSSLNFTNTGSSGVGYSYSWDFGSGANPQSSTAQNPSGIVYSSGGTKTITFAITNQFECASSITNTLSIYSTPVANAGKDTTICSDTTVPIGSASLAGNTYSWFPSSTLSNSTLANPVANPIAPVTNYILTVTNTSTGCKAQDSAVVTMLAPLVADAGMDGEICLLDNIQIGAGLITGQTYSWLPSTGLSSLTLANPIADPTATTTYTVTVSGGGCTPVTDEVTIIVHPLPVADAGANDTITTGSNTQLSANGGIQYSWLPVTGLNNWSIYNPLANPIANTTYTVTVTDIYGCKNQDSVSIIVIPPSLWIPSAFTPDENGHNDMLFVRGDGIENFEFGVFNRWGEQVFYSTNIQQGWDGKKQVSGEEMPEGAYVYFIKGKLPDGNVINMNGLVNLIR